MPTLTEIAALKGADFSRGVVDFLATEAPELARVSGDPIPGTTYKMPSVASKPSGGFRAANEGVPLQKATQKDSEHDCYIFDLQTEIDRLVADAHPMGRDAYLAFQTLMQAEGAGETIGSQFYYGTAAGSDKGFIGLQARVAEELNTMGVDAGDDAANAVTSAYLIFNNPLGCRFLFGANGSLESPEAWQMAKATRTVSGQTRKFDVYQNSLAFWIGLQHTPGSVSRIYNIATTVGGSNELSDLLVAKAAEKHRTSRTPNLVLMPRVCGLQIAAARAAKAGSTGDLATNYGGLPTSVAGIPIVYTDRILKTEAVVS